MYASLVTMPMPLQQTSIEFDVDPVGGHRYPLRNLIILNVP